MSVEAMTVVLHHSKAKGTAKLVLLGIANHQGDGGAWPSVATLATYANVDERSVQRALGTLRGMGEIRVDVQGGGLREHADHMRPNRYEVLVACPPWCDRSTSHRDTRKRSGRQTSIPVAVPVDKGGDTGVTRTPETLGGGDTGVTRGVTLASPEPSIEPNHRGSISASTTDRARRVPADEVSESLDEVRARLRRATAQHQAEENNRIGGDLA